MSFDHSGGKPTTPFRHRKGAAADLEASRQAPGCPGCGLLTNLLGILAPPNPQQPIGCWLWPFSVAGVGFNVAGVVFYVAGVVLGGQQAGPGGLRGAGY